MDLLRRDGTTCPWCGTPLGAQGVRHHRQPRRIQGDRLSGLVLLHDGCHTSIHSHPEDARARGFIVSIHSDPLDVPVQMARPRSVVAEWPWWLLDDAGEKVRVDPPA